MLQPSRKLHGGKSRRIVESSMPSIHTPQPTFICQSDSRPTVHLCLWPRQSQVNTHPRCRLLASITFDTTGGVVSETMIGLPSSIHQSLLATVVVEWLHHLSTRDLIGAAGSTLTQYILTLQLSSTTGINPYTVRGHCIRVRKKPYLSKLTESSRPEDINSTQAPSRSFRELCALVP